MGIIVVEFEWDSRCWNLQQIEKTQTNEIARVTSSTDSQKSIVIFIDVYNYDFFICLDQDTHRQFGNLVTYLFCVCIPFLDYLWSREYANIRIPTLLEYNYRYY